jgi:uncharacterized protein YjbI with pentapeptide repeats
MAWSRMVRSVVVVAALAGGIAGVAGTGAARAAGDCPTVVIPSGSIIGTVVPAPSPGVDWSGCDLAHANLDASDLTNVNLTGADLYDSELFGAQIVDSNLTSANLDSDDFEDSTITGTDLTGADISLAYFDVATLTGIRSGRVTDPSGVPTLPSGWKLDNGYLLGPGDDFSGVDFPALAVKPDLATWDLTGSTFDGANLTGVSLEDDTLTGAQFANANLTNTDLYGGILTAANLQGAILTGSNLTAVESGSITSTPAKLPANWSLRDGYLLGPKAGLVSAGLAGVDLTGADLNNADLYLATLAGANLTDVNFDGSGVLDGTDVTGATWSNTTCPDGTNSDNDGGTCVNNNDDVAPQALPAISGASLNGWYSEAAVTWNWSDFNGTIDPARCVTSTATTTEGAPAKVAATCWNVEGLKGTATVSIDVENKPPMVTVTGPKAGQIYAAGHVPAGGCRTTDALSGVARNAKLTVATTGSHGVGAFTAACVGGLNVAQIQAAPVKLTYTVAYGLSAFLGPKSKATVARSAHSFPVTIKLANITASLAAKLAAAGGVRATLSGPGVSPVTVALKWQPKTGTFSARLPIPAKVKTGQNYQISIRENVGTGLTTAPRSDATVNPGIIRFK